MTRADNLRVILKALYVGNPTIIIDSSHLIGVRVEHVVEGEGLVCPEDHLRLARRHECARPAHVDYFTGNLRAYPVKERKKTS